MRALQGRLVYSKGTLQRIGAGAFSYAGFGNIEHAGLVFKCPCGCGNTGLLSFLPNKGGHNAPVFGWDGNLEAPTVRPGLNLECGWRGQLTKGVWEPEVVS